jgi:hypothetical protein
VIGNVEIITCDNVIAHEMIGNIEIIICGNVIVHEMIGNNYLLA